MAKINSALTNILRTAQVAGRKLKRLDLAFSYPKIELNHQTNVIANKAVSMLENAGIISSKQAKKAKLNIQNTAVDEKSNLLMRLNREHNAINRTKVGKTNVRRLAPSMGIFESRQLNEDLYGSTPKTIRNRLYGIVRTDIRNPSGYDGERLRSYRLPTFHVDSFPEKISEKLKQKGIQDYKNKRNIAQIALLAGAGAGIAGIKSSLSDKQKKQTPSLKINKKYYK